MRRDQLEHAIRTACQIIGHDAVVVVSKAPPIRPARTHLAYGKKLKQP